jgi:AraC-like DNA-binding protein
VSVLKTSRTFVPARAPAASSEGPSSKASGAGRRPLFGGCREFGFSFEWHEFTPKEIFVKGSNLPPGSVEICLNLAGKGTLSNARRTFDLLPQTLVIGVQNTPPLTVTRQMGEHHRFISIGFSPDFLVENFRSHVDCAHPLVRRVVRGETLESQATAPEPMSVALHRLVESLRHCPVFNPAREMWFRSKALEVAAHLFFRPEGGELLCTRTQRLARERVERAKFILQERMQNPPSLDELARMVSCSPFYLSRQFAQAGGMTMQQFLRQIRMERAAELLRTGKCNVTEAAFEVGYNSLSHFSTTFHETFGCCPGLYPLRTESQQTDSSKK